MVVTESEVTNISNHQCAERERQKLLEHKGVNLSEFLVFKRPQAGSTERIYYPSFFPWFYKHYLFPLSFCYMLVI